jgi:hypothetical protein
MKITWDWSLESETHRVVDSARQIGNGFFHLQHFLALPWSKDTKYLHSGVYLPSLNYRAIPGFWTKSSKLTTGCYPLDIPTELAQPIKSELSNLHLISPDTTKLKELTESTLPQVIQFIRNLSPNSNLPTHLTIHPTCFGTGGSFAWNKEHNEIIIFLRSDRGIKTIVECLLTCILRKDAMDQLAATWSETEFLIDWLVESSSLSPLLPADPSWLGTLKHTRFTPSATTLKLSHDFLIQIGATLDSQHSFTIKENVVSFNGQKLENLTTRESAILTILISKSPVPISNDEIGNILFNSDEKFSLSAITKTIERLRTKLETMGISRHYLATASGVGYYLKN